MTSPSISCSVGPFSPPDVPLQHPGLWLPQCKLRQPKQRSCYLLASPEELWEVTWDSAPHPAQGRVEEKSRVAGEAQPRVQLSIRIWYSSSAGASCLPALVCFQSHLSPVSWMMSVWFGQGLVNRLCAAVTSSGEMRRAWCACWLKAWQGAGWAKQLLLGWDLALPLACFCATVMFPMADGVSSGLIKDHNLT